VFGAAALQLKKKVAKAIETTRCAEKMKMQGLSRFAKIGTRDPARETLTLKTGNAAAGLTNLRTRNCSV